MVELPGRVAIDLTPDVIAAMDEVNHHHEGLDLRKESIRSATAGGDVPTLVEFT